MARKVKGPSFDPNLLLATTGRGRTKLEYRSEGVIFSQGDAADSIFYILRGKIKIVVTSKQGREAVVAVLGEGDFFGEGCLIAQPLRLATAASMIGTTVMRVEKAEMLRLLHAEPHFAEVFTVHLLTRNGRVEADLADHLFNSSEKRLARALLLLANFGKEGRPEPIIAKISQETLAEMIGTTASRQLLHEQIQEARLHRIQWSAAGPQFATERRAARIGASAGPTLFVMWSFLTSQRFWNLPS